MARHGQTSRKSTGTKAMMLRLAGRNMHHSARPVEKITQGLVPSANPAVPVKQLDAAQVGLMQVTELRAALAERGLSAKGRKPELAARLIERTSGASPLGLALLQPQSPPVGKQLQTFCRSLSKAVDWPKFCDFDDDELRGMTVTASATITALHHPPSASY